MIVKIKPIMADYAKEEHKVGGVRGIKNCFRYITDPEKVIVNRNDVHKVQAIDRDNLELGPEEMTEGNQARVLNYMANEEKIEGKYISGYLCDPDVAVDQFNAMREQTLKKANRRVKKETGPVAFHMIQSFPEGLDISDEEVHQCGIELCERIHAHQAIVCSHVHPIVDDDNEVHGKCKHNHILFNAYIHPDKLDPEHPKRLKYHDCDETYAQLRIWNDEIAIAHGLPIIRNPDDDRLYSWKETDAINKGLSWKQRVRLDIEEIRRACSSWDEFVQQMGDAGYKIKAGTHVTYTTPDGKHKTRGNTLGRQYSKENLELYWKYRSYAFHAIEAEENNNPSPALLDTVLSVKGSLRAAVPIGMKSSERREFYYLPMDGVTQANDVLATYFNENELYDICDEQNRPVCAATGKEIIACMDQLRLGKDHALKGKQGPGIDPEGMDGAGRNDSDSRYFVGASFINSRTKKPYRTSLYDQNGRRRSTLELMFMLAIVVLKKEEGLWDAPIVPNEKENDPLFAPRSWKIQNMVDSIYTARDENIETLAELDQRLNDAGAAFSRARSALKKTVHAKEKMETLNEAIRDYRKTAELAEQILAMPEGPNKELAKEEYKEALELYTTAKAVLYQYKVTSEEAILDFEQRYEKIQEDIIGLEEKLDDAKEEYRRIKKLSYNLELAQNKQYCYGPNYTYDNVPGQTEELDTDDTRSKRAAQKAEGQNDTPTDSKKKGKKQEK